MLKRLLNPGENVEFLIEGALISKIYEFKQKVSTSRLLGQFPEGHFP